LKIHQQGTRASFSYSQEVAAEAAYRFALQTIRNEIKRLHATRRRISIHELAEFIDKELNE